MLFNNPNVGKEFFEAVVDCGLYYEIKGSEGQVIPPPDTDFLLDNSGDIIFDNSEEQILVQ